MDHGAILTPHSSEQTLIGLQRNESAPDSQPSRPGPSSLPLLERNDSLESQGSQTEWFEDNNPEQSNDTTRGFPWLWVFRVWKFQLSASLLCSASLAGLAIMAATFSDRPLADWPLSFISINGVVAILTVLLKDPLMVLIADSISQAKWPWFSREGQAGRPLVDLELIDNASRGPWGSFVWLYKHPLGLHLISFGALLTMLVAGVDVFSQLLITTEGKVVIDPGQKAHVPWAMNNSAPIYGPASALMPKTWMSCSDLLCNYTIDGEQQSWPDVMNAPKPNSVWKLDDLRRLFPPPSNVTGTREYDMPLSVLVLIRGGTNSSIGTHAEWLEDGHISIGAFAVFEIPIKDENDELDFSISFGEPVVTRCSFWFCMQGIPANVDSGRPRQTVASTERASYATTLDSWRGMVTTEPLGGTFSDVPDFNMKGRNFSVTPLNPSSPGQQESSTISTSSVFGDTPMKYISFTWWSKPQGPANLETPPPRNAPLFFRAWEYTANDRSAWANRIAKSLTNIIHLQSQPDPKDDVYAGNAWIQQTYIKVSWPWIAYPIAVLLASLLLFAGNIYRSSSPNQRIWGTGMLALLISDIDRSIKDQARGSSCRSNDELIEATGHAVVRLEDDESGWVFRHDKDSK
ncbi:uncharacterized protein F4812DRAFT_468128 [Daldinia caldariorum]|uniref:uncharacterized protein n=1 Tax=Daldinia caldariorum TaxID=326644 RepID=UPI0020072740|nr:uncharacterized protein F4812DRAFT_468128 [Daldinia caldariorum]KAI1464197.1 hypothetical protein F4812DRAFT_468128 [Daldinia caldariorum]